MIELLFKLVRPARKKGGDRYEADLKGESKPFVVYFPQTICRVNDVPVYEIAMTLMPKE